MKVPQLGPVREDGDLVQIILQWCTVKESKARLLKLTWELAVPLLPHSSYMSHCTTPSPPNASSHWKSGSPSNTSFSRPTRPITLNGTSIESAIFPQYMLFTDRQPTGHRNRPVPTGFFHYTAHDAVGPDKILSSQHSGWQITPSAINSSDLLLASDCTEVWCDLAEYNP